MKDKVSLYIATHNKTGLKYLGRSSKYFTQEDLQKYYHGSGSYWLKHLEKHGDDVTMELVGVYSSNPNSKNYIKPVAIKISEDNNIVKAKVNGKKVWANLKKEDGFYSYAAGYQRGITNVSKRPEVRKILSKHLKNNNPSKKKIKCQYCNIEMGSNNFYSYHGNNCKHNSNYKKSKKETEKYIKIKNKLKNKIVYKNYKTKEKIVLDITKENNYFNLISRKSKDNIFVFEKEYKKYIINNTTILKMLAGYYNVTHNFFFGWKDIIYDVNKVQKRYRQKWCNGWKFTKIKIKDSDIVYNSKEYKVILNEEDLRNIFL